jgi:CTP:molybdopterin cytidylyltransferase MocA
VTPFKALVLAGSRGGVDPVAAYAGVAHKALVRLQGQTLLARVVGALRAAGAAQVAVVSSHLEVRVEAARLGVEALDEAAGPSLSVKAGAAAVGTPLLVTTADHALLQAAWVERFLLDVPVGTDVAALIAARAIVEAAAPGTQRTWLKLADGHWSGCNLFYLANDRALGVVDLWRRVEAERKRPWRMAQILGAGMLLRYAAGQLSLTDAAARLGKLAGVRAAIVETPFGLASVDVDKPADLDLVRRMVGELGQAPPGASPLMGARDQT